MKNAFLLLILLAGSLFAQTNEGPIVTAIDGYKVQIDGNHPLAGKTLTMEIRVVDVTRDEPEPDVSQH